ncbi:MULTISPECIES: CDP-alcohol phosphatidyltransferase family protein [unclassified Streptomyces]|uniref:CDP-alcohol phosphatidyltransferase family protein n=1 Tax=unclassified Streptomyces TaxID=2593676 RepID=UPI002E29A176|nr:CDP-alcohol phosphatidyltransferase family protein [Streptomyces sp. NBC_01423]WSX89423.1 CDP-alcohol phosphatidyltransferase family protein [Streptomyces sp. NBC_00891]WSY03902.1 CDP-alcohol phosphatidyltransferase family protein [Streptomyces sp. NBC_00890]WSZ05528.1 CDP-alcohol phosphatidyltransferase family protein [Streptomyces sp. NBC_00869]WSZ26976.1 CDP-alcohol phosphatidyltransferase family protein [Streptomyces sp. NBC_00870]
MESTSTVLRQLRGAQKPAKGVSLYSRYVNRPAGRVFAVGAYRLGLTPNQVTLVSAVFTFGALAGVALVRPGPWPALLVYLGLAVGFALDSADGQLARLTGRGGPDGEWLDHVVDCAKMVLVHTAVLVSFQRWFALPGDGWLLLPLGFLFVAVLTFCAGLLRDQLGRTAAAAPAPAPAAPPSRLRAVALLPADYGVFCLVFLLLGDETAFRVGYAVLAAVHALFLVLFLGKWFRELKALRAH